MVKALIGCDWGTTIALTEDEPECKEQATQRVVLHDPGSPWTQMVQVCDFHAAALDYHTDPHKEAETPS